MAKQAGESAGGVDRNEAGKLFLVGTPIGNLEDITWRAVRTLRECAVIACEDTRQTQKLLNRYHIKTRSTSYHEHNEKTRGPELIRRLESGQSVALVSDAGMPAISDPGYRLVRECIERRIAVIPVPGPTAVIAALVASGIPAQPFQFLGFVPPKRQQRRKFLEGLGGYPGASVFFEAPHRILETLAELRQILGDRRIALAREMTKAHEEFLRGCCAEVLELLRLRPRILGEITVVVEGAPAASPPQAALPLR
ncbi:MAG TPA: 16S rRNA (cytidine(1402)-2'-O)-methyltransferase, partial [Terriglobia bacterium]|nr:16S rRNA (cytidine(1402)-2'-O)-methyltransferase [Terriglobia bacterium]